MLFFSDDNELPFTEDDHAEEKSDFPKLCKLYHSTISINYLIKL